MPGNKQGKSGYQPRSHALHAWSAGICLIREHAHLRPNSPTCGKYPGGLASTGVRPLLALLGLVLVLPIGLGCRVSLAAVAIKAPCCGPNCPIPSSAGEGSCCEQSASRSTVENVSPKPHVPSLAVFTGLIFSHLVVPGPSPFGQPPCVDGSPPGVARLALLCSRQI